MIRSLSRARLAVESLEARALLDAGPVGAVAWPVAEEGLPVGPALPATPTTIPPTASLLHTSQLFQHLAVVTGPRIVDFSAVAARRDVWVFRGRVEGDGIDGATVHFSGLPSVEGRTVFVQEGGAFYLIVRLRPGETGTVSARVITSDGVTSPTARVFVSGPH